jgi:hypothetical protein
MEATLEITRRTPIDAIFSFIGAERIRISKDVGGKLNVAPIIDWDGSNVNWQNPDEVLNALNSVYAKVDSRLDEVFEHAQTSTLKDDW